MASPDSNHKKRPPPIKIPLAHPLHPALAPSISMNASQVQSKEYLLEQDSQNVSLSIYPGTSLKNSSQFVSPMEQNALHPSQTDSSHSCSSAATKFSRAQIESRSERKLFKLTGQIPPTLSSGSTSGDDVFIRTQDFRAQCRAVSEERQREQEALAKSSRKKLFGSIRNPFSKMTNDAPVPDMPSKAAQVFGTAPRERRMIRAHPIKPAHPLRTPPTVRRSDTTKSLPTKVFVPGDDSPYHGRYEFLKSNDQSSNADNHALALSSSEHNRPPTPPAKDTPPKDLEAPGLKSPLRRAAPAQDLRESYMAEMDREKKSCSPPFILLPTRFSMEDYRRNGLIPPKSRPYTAGYYTKISQGEALQWSHQEDVDEALPTVKKVTAIGKGVLISSSQRSEATFDQKEHKSPGQLGTTRDFDSSSHRQTGLFAEHDSVPQISDNLPSPFNIPSKPSFPSLRAESNSGSIEMMFRGDPNDIDSQSSTARLIDKKDRDGTKEREAAEKGPPADPAQANVSSERPDAGSRMNDTPGCLPYDRPSSSISDLLKGMRSHVGNFDVRFEPSHPSALPSPLHPMTAPGAALPLHMQGTDPGPFHSYVQPQTGRTVDEHFAMTNEHLDVVGKTTWDLLEGFNQRQIAAHNMRCDRIINMLEKHAEEIKSQVNAADEKASRAAEKQSERYTHVDKKLNLIKTEISDASTAQDMKTNQMERHIKELQQELQALHKLVEQKFKNTKTTQQQNVEKVSGLGNPDISTLPAHRSQPSIIGYYGTAADIGHETHPPAPPDFITSPTESHNSLYRGYGNNYGPQWSSRHGYTSRNGRDQYAGTHPYPLPHSGAYSSNLYGSSFPSPNSEQHYGFNQK